MGRKTSSLGYLPSAVVVLGHVQSLGEKKEKEKTGRMVNRAA